MVRDVTCDVGGKERKGEVQGGSEVWEGRGHGAGNLQQMHLPDATTTPILTFFRTSEHLCKDKFLKSLITSGMPPDSPAPPLDVEHPPPT